MALEVDSNNSALFSSARNQRETPALVIALHDVILLDMYRSQIRDSGSNLPTIVYFSRLLDYVSDL